MVYVLRADRPIRYDAGHSRIVYIGETNHATAVSYLVFETSQR